MSTLKRTIVKPIVIAAFVLTLLLSLVITASMMQGGPTRDGGGASISRIELQSHNGPGKHKRCKPKGKYGKPKKPKKCRRRDN
jgi:hypothetical protein